MKEKRTNLFHVPVGMLEIEDGFNVREDFGDIQGLCDSIIENGIKVPLRGYKKKGEEMYIITDGHRRLRAAQMAQDQGVELLVPMVKEGKNLSDESKVFSMLVTNDGKPLNLVEKSTAFERLINYGHTATDIAKKIGKSVTHVNDCLLLASASTSLKKQIISGKVSATAIIDELRKSSPEEVEKKVKRTIDKKKAKKKVSGSDLGNTPKKFSISKIKKVYESLETKKEEDTMYDPEKVKLLGALVSFAEGVLDIDKLEKYFWIDE